MAKTIEIQESAPSSRPIIVIAAIGNVAAILERAWLRIEEWTAYRWAARNVVFIVDGAGEWTPPLSPFTLSTAESWQDDAWTPATLRPTALGGFVFDECKTWRVTGVLGSTAAPPENVMEAVRRLARYFSETENSRATDGGLRRIDRHEKTSVELQTGWSAKAMQYSGAADLLRSYRKLGTE